MTDLQVLDLALAALVLDEPARQRLLSSLVRGGRIAVSSQAPADDDQDGQRLLAELFDLCTNDRYVDVAQRHQRAKSVATQVQRLVTLERRLWDSLQQPEDADEAPAAAREGDGGAEGAQRRHQQRQRRRPGVAELAESGGAAAPAARAGPAAAPARRQAAVSQSPPHTQMPTPAGRSRAAGRPRAAAAGVAAAVFAAMDVDEEDADNEQQQASEQAAFPAVSPRAGAGRMAVAGQPLEQRSEPAAKRKKR
jgi:hypothetical protein